MEMKHKPYLSDTDQSGRTTERYLGPDAQDFDDDAKLAEEFVHAHVDNSHINRYVADHGTVELSREAGQESTYWPGDARIVHTGDSPADGDTDE
jgi:hypothetical protein